MKKTLVAALMITAVMGGQVFADPGILPAPNNGPYWDAFGYAGSLWVNGAGSGFGAPPAINKVALLNVSLNNQFQAYKKGSTWGVTTTPARGSGNITISDAFGPFVVGVNPPPGTFATPPVIATPNPPFQAWDTLSYYTIQNCADQPTKYASSSQVINNAYLIKAINAAFSTPGGLFRVASANPANPNPYRGGSFTTSAKIVVINYENQIPAPPYPPTVDNFYAAAFQLNNDPVFNAPYDLLNSPNVAPDGTILPLNWPNQNYIAWGKPFTPAGGLAAAVATWIGNQVFIIDPNNGNPNLQCFDVTPLFEFSEAYCFYCWDTFDRVTDGKIQGSSSAPPCNPASGCGQTGNGITKWYWTVKFNNIGAAWPLNPNFLIDLYYGPTLLNVGGGPDWWTAFANGAQLNDANKTASASALAFTVNGIATYTWNYKILSTAVTAPMGAMTMSSSGFGYSPMCGVFSGPVSLTEYDRSNPMFNNKVSKASVLCF